MTNTLTISRELAERLDSPHSSVRNAALESLRRIIAAPVVERQEPIYQVQYLGDGGGGWSDVGKEAFDALLLKPREWMTRIVYTSPPAPVAVVPEGWKLVPIVPTMGMLEALGSGGRLATSMPTTTSSNPRQPASTRSRR